MLVRLVPERLSLPSEVVLVPPIVTCASFGAKSSIIVGNGTGRWRGPP